MRAKHVCFACRKAFNVPYGNMGPVDCPNCNQSLVILTHRFRPPKKREGEKWAVVKFLVNYGFFYQHISYERMFFDDKNGWRNVSGYAQYPENMREAKEFVITYREQAVSVAKLSV